VLIADWCCSSWVLMMVLLVLGVGRWSLVAGR
jgi:hypothetical protein